MLTPIQTPRLASLKHVRHGFFTREGGVSTGLYASLNCGLGSQDKSDSVLENRRRVSEHLGGTHGQVVTLYQEHGTRALTVTAPLPRTDLPRADAVVTATPGLVIGVLTADCAPVLFADPVAGIVAAAHAGWRGAAAGILESTVAEMERIGAQRSRITASLGPCINQPAYEVGPEFEAQLLALAPSNGRFFTQANEKAAHPAKAKFDLPGYVLNRLNLIGLGVIENGAACTYENESQFFSFRRTTHQKEPDYGRQISAIVVT